MNRITLDINRPLTDLFEYFSNDRDAIFLQSEGKHPSARFSFFSSNPEQTLNIDHKNFCSNSLEQTKTELRKALATHQTHDKSLPFCGGWIGFANYELNYALSPKAGLFRPTDSTQAGSSPQPLLWAGFYSWAVIQNQDSHETHLISLENMPEGKLAKLKQRLDEVIGQLKNDASQALNAQTSFSCSEFKALTTKEQYQQDFNRIQSYLSSGDCYQINYAMAYESHYLGSAFQAYRQLSEAVPSPFMAYINQDAQAILSISPERFLAADEKQVLSSPIKGTAPRGDTTINDQELANSLQKSTKNRAENLMIVDLLRNDIGKLCKPGSIKADRLFEIESFSNVHHLVSHIDGELLDDKDIFDLFFDAFPGGSITGAPKLRAMQIIRELEDFNRDIYCGSIFCASTNGLFDSNIAIRTLRCDKDQKTIKAWAGGGIVKDSEVDSEYEECQNKIGKLLNALSTF